MQTLHAQRYPVLLESAAASLQGSNHDILMAFPGERLTLHAQHGLHTPPSIRPSAPGFLGALDQWWRQLHVAQPATDLPFNGGWFIYLSYELAAEIEPVLHGLQPDGVIAEAVRIPAAIVRRSDSGEAWFVAEGEAEQYLSIVAADLAQARHAQPDAAISTLRVHEDAASAFVDVVANTLEHIAAGDIYQANLSRGYHAQLAQHCSPQAIYRALRAANPAPFAGLALLSDAHAIISSSPERLIELRNGWANTRPIAGTRPRHADPSADQALLEELRAHPKERAEHIMLLDLERNDLGRICVGGTVEVDEYMSIESYAHVHHIVSNVRGRLRTDVTPGEAIAAVFPGGTITGCPKVRCMEIIAELEHTARRAYTGSMGYLNRDGSMDLNILIRTLELQGDTLTFRAGAGIVADSIPERELEETRAKALGMIRALQS
jgi:4-amino-4-deoxychorismate synthase (2-amino-4-deoxychorismate-forming) component I